VCDSIWTIVDSYNPRTAQGLSIASGDNRVRFNALLTRMRIFFPCHNEFDTMTRMSDIQPTESPLPSDALGYAPTEDISPEKIAARARMTVRLICSIIFFVSAAMLAVGFKLTPSTNGTGTHQELGLPPCGMLEFTGYPCPTCGCTTAVSHFAHGNLISSFVTQPFGFGVALLASLLVPFTFMGVATGTWYGPTMFWLSWHWQKWVYGTLGVLALAWIYKIIIIKMHITF